MSEPNSQPSYAVPLLTCCLVSFACFFGAYLRIPVVPLHAVALGASATQVGAINAAFMLAAGLLAIPAGLLSDRLGRRTVILSGLLLIAISSFLLYVSTTPTEMIGIYLLFGIGLAAYSPSMMSYVADLAPPNQMGRAYSLYTVSYNLAMMLGPAAGGFIGHAFGLRSVFLVSGGVILLMFLVARPLLPHPPRIAPAVVALEPALRTLLRNTRFLACLLGTVGGCFGFGMFITFVPIHLSAMGMDVGVIGLIFATQALSNALSRIPFGFLIDYCSDRCTLATLGLASLAIALVLFGLSTSLPWLLAFAALLGISMGVGFTALATLLADAVPSELRGLAMGAYNSCIYLGMMVNAATMGTVVSRFGSAVAFFFAGITTLLLVFLFFALYRKEKSHSQNVDGICRS